jgi:hypothetical protein
MREKKKGGRLDSLEVARSHGKRAKTLLIYCYGRGGLKYVGTRLLISPFEVTVLVDTSKEKKGSNVTTREGARLVATRCASHVRPKMYIASLPVLTRGSRTQRRRDK